MPGQIDIPGDVSGTGQWEAIPAINMSLANTTEYGSSFSVTDLTQSGYAPGQLTSMSIDSSGVILARYSNGQSKPAGQIELATFRNVQGLQPLGGNEWATIGEVREIPRIPYRTWAADPSIGERLRGEGPSTSD